jgi:uncharacterized protein (TIGR02145 family)
VGFITQGNAVAVKVLDVPTGWTVAVQHDKEKHAGTFTVTAPSEDTDALTALVLVSDAAGNTVIRTLNLTAYQLSAASTQTWTFGSQTWSDVIQISDCNKDDYSNSDTEPRCRSYTSDKLRYYYNWSYVTTYAATLCPSPWKVPASSDFNTLISDLGGNTQNARDALIAAWVYGGYANSTSVSNTGSQARYWSSTQYNSGTAYYLYFDSSGNVSPQNSINKYYGYQVRCVK